MNAGGIDGSVVFAEQKGQLSCTGEALKISTALKFKGFDPIHPRKFLSTEQ